jgi:hypothetical protein
VFIALGIEAGGEVFVGNYVEWEPTIYYAYCWIAGTDSNCPGAYACQMEDSSFCWLGYFDQVYMCEACPQTEGEFEVVCAEAVRQLVQACLGGGDSINCESYGPLGYCYDVKGCCYTRRGQCWYEADDGTRFYCAEGSCDAAAQDAYDHCTYGG